MTDRADPAPGARAALATGAAAPGARAAVALVGPAAEVLAGRVDVDLADQRGRAGTGRSGPVTTGPAIRAGKMPRRSRKNASSASRKAANGALRYRPVWRRDPLRSTSSA